MPHSITDLGYRIEVRGESPDPSVPASGQLVAYAYRPNDEDHWEVRHRDGRHTTATDRYQAAGMLLSLVFATDPTEQTGRGEQYTCGTCGNNYEAYSPENAAARHDLRADHPFTTGGAR